MSCSWRRSLVGRQGRAGQGWIARLCAIYCEQEGELGRLYILHLDVRCCE